jgi:hypothetical protein
MKPKPEIWIQLKEVEKPMTLRDEISITGKWILIGLGLFVVAIIVAAGLAALL